MGKLIWLASYPKSGNTWLRAFLHNLLRNPDEAFDINQLGRFSLHDSDIEWFERLDSRPPERWTKEEIARMRPKAQALMTEQYPDLIFVKTHNALVENRGTPMIALEHTAAAIYVVRNPLDVVISYADHLDLTLDQTVALMARDDETPVLVAHDDGKPTENRVVYEYRGSWSRHVNSWTGRPHPALLVLRYEDALDNPEQVFGALARFLGVSPPETRLRRAIEFSSFDALRAQEEATGFSERMPHQERFFRSGKAGQWREALSKGQVRRIVSSHGEQMARFGYVPKGY